MNVTRDRRFVAFHTILAIAVLASTAVPCRADSYKRWDFNTHGDRQGWTVPANFVGAVMGGSLWLAFTPDEKDPEKVVSAIRQDVGADFVYGQPPPNADVLSPRGLDLPTPASVSTQLQVRMRVLNLSPVTDVFLRWRTRADVDKFPNARRCSLQADLKSWQEVICPVTKSWRGQIDQVALDFSSPPVGSPPIRGDLWIEYIEIAEGPADTVPKRPDVASDRVVPRISVPGISQGGFADAFAVLDEALMIDVPVYGFTHPVMSPGGLYHGNWWLLDAAATVGAAKWANQGFADDVMRGFHDVEAANPDGRIPRAGWARTRGQVSDLSMLSPFFEVAYDVARRTGDPELRREIYRAMRTYLEWWLSPVKRDRFTGLISGSSEETFGEDETLARFFSDHALQPQSLAPVDLNVEIAVGARRTADLAAKLDESQDAQKYEAVFADLSRSINAYMWDDLEGVYYNYDLRRRQTHRRMLVTTFDPLRLGIAPPSRRERLLKRLLDPAQFNWGRRPLTSAAMTDRDFTEPKEEFDFNTWLGAVWTVRNVQVIAGLRESGRPHLAAELNWATIREFHENYQEYVIPSTGRGGGNSKRYAVSAAHYIQAIIEVLFGVDFDVLEHRLRIAPHVPAALYNRELTLENLILPGTQDTRLSLHIKQSTTKVAAVQVNVSGELPSGDLVVAVPGTAKQYRVPVQHSFMAQFE